MGRVLSSVRAARPAMLRILVLGGTGFIGPSQVEYALSRGHKLTLFNRGRTHADLFPGVEKLEGDREGKLDALKGRKWDAVIDNSGYLPRHVRDSASLLKDAVDQYLFISTLSVYPSFPTPDIDESAPIAKLDVATDDTRQYYGPLKAECERALSQVFGDRATVVRPGVVAGPGDPTDRFTYWVHRVLRGGEVLAPGAPTDPVRYIDVRDLAEFCIHLLEQRTRGTYNTVGPASPMSIAELLYGLRALTSTDVSFTWVDTEFLIQQKVEPFSAMPLWRPPRDGFEGFGRVSRRRAITAGLRFRPLMDTARDTMAWFEKLPAERRAKLVAGLPADREAAVLTAWHQRTR
jgi:2'-hydroxyisoflavone reductase